MDWAHLDNQALNAAVSSIVRVHAALRNRSETDSSAALQQQLIYLHANAVRIGSQREVLVAGMSEEALEKLPVQVDNAWSPNLNLRNHSRNPSTNLNPTGSKPEPNPKPTPTPTPTPNQREPEREPESNPNTNPTPTPTPTGQLTEPPRTCALV